MNVQKNLDWLWRLFFYSPDQPLPNFARVILPTVDVTLDWPQVPTVKTQDYSTVAGIATTTLLVPAGRHWLVDHWSIYGDFAAADAIVISMLSPGGSLDVRLKYTIPGAISDNYPIVGAVGNSSAVGNPIPGKLYVPGGWSLRIQHISVAGGLAFSNRMVVRDYPDFAPLRSL